MRQPEPEPSFSWTFAVPVLCALHCAAAPLLVGLLPALALSATMEWLLMGGSMVFAAAVVGGGYREHRLGAIAALMVAGFAVWALSLAGTFEPLPEVATTMAGSLLVALSLFWTSRRSMRSRGEACGCPGCDHTEAAPVPRPATGAALRERGVSASSA